MPRLPQAKVIRYTFEWPRRLSGWGKWVSWGDGRLRYFEPPWKSRCLTNFGRWYQRRHYDERPLDWYTVSSTESQQATLTTIHKHILARAFLSRFACSDSRPWPGRIICHMNMYLQLFIFHVLRHRLPLRPEERDIAFFMVWNSLYPYSHLSVMNHFSHLQIFLR